jgi:RNA polymerase sigma-70 factor (ECF subfamily)
MTVKMTETEKQFTDEELVERIKAGDSEALDMLVRTYFHKVYHRVRSLVPEADAEDVTQDIFLSLVDSIHSFRGRSAFGTWFHRIVMNKVADFHRKASRRKEQLSEEQPLRSTNPWNATNDELIVKEALKELPEKHKIVLILKFSEGLSFAEMAERLDLTYEATRSRYRRAVEAARDQMARDRK